MKKVLLGLAAIAAFLNVSAQRTVDIETSIVSPQAGSTVFAGAAFDILYRVTNNGPDDLKPGDTLTSFLVLGNQIQLPTQQAVVLTAALANGASRDYTRNFQIGGGSSGKANICMLVVVNNRSGVDTVRDNLAGGNNVGCVEVNYNADGNSVGEISANTLRPSLYPNPVNSAASLNFYLNASAEVSVKLFDLSGRLVATVFNGTGEVGVNAIPFTTEGLANGVYVYKIETSNQSVSNKFILAR